jgi:hypothetical protein
LSADGEVIGVKADVAVRRFLQRYRAERHGRPARPLSRPPSKN